MNKFVYLVIFYVNVKYVCCTSIAPDCFIEDFGTGSGKFTETCLGASPFSRQEYDVLFPKPDFATSTFHMRASYESSDTFACTQHTINVLSRVSIEVSYYTSFDTTSLRSSCQLKHSESSVPSTLTDTSSKWSSVTFREISVTTDKLEIQISCDILNDGDFMAMDYIRIQAEPGTNCDPPITTTPTTTGETTTVTTPVTVEPTTTSELTTTVTTPETPESTTISESTTVTIPETSEPTTTSGSTTTVTTSETSESTTISESTTVTIPETSEPTTTYESSTTVTTPEITVPITTTDESTAAPTTLKPGETTSISPTDTTESAAATTTSTEIAPPVTTPISPTSDTPEPEPTGSPGANDEPEFWSTTVIAAVSVSSIIAIIIVGKVGLYLYSSIFPAKAIAATNPSIYVDPVYKVGRIPRVNTLNRTYPNISKSIDEYGYHSR